MTTRALSTSLTGSAATLAVVAGASANQPDVPWWGHLIMVLVSAALAFFGGQAQARGR